MELLNQSKKSCNIGIDSVIGIYCGVLPSDVETTLTLNADGTYLLIQSYNENTTVPLKWTNRSLN